MNVLFVNATREWAGIKTWMLHLATFLSQRGHHIAVVCRHHDPLIAECATRNLTCYPFHFGADYSLRTIRWFLKLFQSRHTEAVITNISKDIRSGGVAAKLRGLAHINRLGNFTDLKKSLKIQLEYSWLVDRVFVPSQKLCDFFAQRKYLRPKLRMFHNAITPPPLHLSQNATVKFAIVANLSKRKQVDKVLQVFSRISDLPWELHIGGFGHELRALKALTRELHLEHRVYFAGGDPDAAEFSKVDPYTFLRDKDVGILYSTQEGFPNVVVEYMGFSCAVIASHIDGIPEIVEHSINGLLVDPHNPDTLEEAIRVLIKKPELRKKLIREGYDTIFPAVEEEIQRTIAQVTR
jgi:glycosyltransferase involved in cell wall biosynthesis